MIPIIWLGIWCTICSSPTSTFSRCVVVCTYIDCMHIINANITHPPNQQAKYHFTQFERFTFYDLLSPKWMALGPWWCDAYDAVVAWHHNKLNACNWLTENKPPANTSKYIYQAPYAPYLFHFILSSFDACSRLASLVTNVFNNNASTLLPTNTDTYTHMRARALTRLRYLYCSNLFMFVQWLRESFRWKIGKSFECNYNLDRFNGIIYANVFALYRASYACIHCMAMVCSARVRLQWSEKVRERDSA